MKREKNYNLELLRVLACVMVVCIHVSNYYSRGYGLGEVSNASYIFSIILNGVSRISVPIFFMISGALLIDETVLIRKSLKRVKSIFLTLLLWRFIYLIWNYCYRNRMYDFRLVFEEPIKSHLWFLYAILGMYIVLPFLQNMFKNMQDILMRYFVGMWFVFLTIEYVLALCDLKVAYQIPLVGDSCYLGYFALGYIIKMTIKKVPIPSYVCYGCSAILLSLVIILTYVFTTIDGVHYEELCQYRNVLIAVSAALVFYDAIKNKHSNYSERTKKTLSFLSKHTFMIYLCHVIFLDIVKLEFAPRSISAFFGIPLYSMFVFVCSLIFSILWTYVKHAWNRLISERRKQNGK